jgi:hypothetical protein
MRPLMARRTDFAFRFLQFGRLTRLASGTAVASGTALAKTRRAPSKDTKSTLCNFLNKYVAYTELHSVEDAVQGRKAVKRTAAEV